MKMKASVMRDLYLAFKKIEQTDSDMSLVGCLDLADNIDVLEKPLKVIEKKRFKLIEKYGPKDENGKLIENEDGTIVITDSEALSNLKEELEKLYASSIDLNAEIKPLHRPDLYGVKITPTEARSLREYIVD